MARWPVDAPAMNLSIKPFAPVGRAMSVPERAGNCGHQRSLKGTANGLRSGQVQVDPLRETHLLSSGSRRRMATVSPGVSADPAGLTAEARPKVRPDQRAADSRPTPMIGAGYASICKPLTLKAYLQERRREYATQKVRAPKPIAISKGFAPVICEILAICG